ncbi:HAMP domain-containing methyl-accepting chemotaxis protein [Xanthobacter sp. V4C-4]|uniref:methyl-accepting chemotaxis protein n=1 Tax=Xanthobacter cornucopiae TaxID=3119924 RepID=UPI003729026B
MSIKRLLSLSIFVIAAIACALAIFMAVRQWEQLTTAQGAAARLDVIRALADVPKLLNPERGLTTLALQTMTASQAAGTELAAFRADTEKAMENIKVRARATLGALDDAAAIVAAAEEIASDYRALRATADEALSRPIDQRGTAWNIVVEKTDAMVTKSSDAMAAQLRRLAAANGVGFAWSDTAVTVLALRNQGGRQAGMLQTLVTAREPVSPAQRDAFFALQGRVEQTWGDLWALRALRTRAPGFVAALETANDDYVQRFADLSRDMLPAFDSGDFPLDGPGYRSKTVRMWSSVIALRDAAFDEAEKAMSGAIQAAWTSLAWALASLTAVVVAVTVILILVSRRAIRPLFDMAGAIEAVAAGNLSTAVPGLGRRDEIGQMANALQVFKTGLERNAALEQEALKARTEAEALRRSEMNALGEQFEKAVGGVVDMVSSAATELQAAAQSLTATAEETSAQAAAVASAADQAASNVQSVAAAIEELAASAHEIGRQVTQSTSIASRAVGQADETNLQMTSLRADAEKVGAIVGLIGDIAAQTNLLALNATIESARAGEAGRGFAVVAQEVKSLAEQTARATADISGQINGMQGSTTGAATTISAIGKTIGDMNAIAAAIVAAVEEQGATTTEVARNVQQAATGANEVRSNITGVTHAAEVSSSAAAQVLSSASELAHHAETLRGEVRKFVDFVKAA